MVLLHFSPWKAKTKLNASTIWLRLRDDHYTWLRPKAGFSDEEEHELFRTACSKADSLVGAGRRQLCAALGLPETSSPCSRPSSVSARRGLPFTGPASGLSVGSSADVALGGSRKRSWAASASSSHAQNHRVASSGKPMHYTVNMLYVCPCGWDPRWWERTERRGGTRASAIRAHWSRCQGCSLPTCTPAERRMRASRIAVQSGRTHRLKYERRLRELSQKHSDLQGCWCHLQLDTPSDHLDTAGRCTNVYYCKVCGMQRTLSRGLLWPCRGRKNNIPTSQFLKTLKGSEWLRLWRGRRNVSKTARSRRARLLAAAALE